MNDFPKPFLKWVGSKRLYLEYINSYIPIEFDKYYEPFLGGASLFFMLQPEEAILSDISEELINSYCAIKENLNGVIKNLANFSGTQEEYYKIRGNRSYGKVKRAAEFIYLNKACWNGLYRVNLKGEFNVPYGLNNSTLNFDIDNLKNCSKALINANAKIITGDFEDIVKTASKYDLVYFDPPYVTTHNNNGFIEYNERLFSWDDQRRLASLATKLKNKGVHVIVSNANHYSIRELYKNFNIFIYQRKSTLAPNPIKRKTVSELIIVNN